MPTIRALAAWVFIVLALAFMVILITDVCIAECLRTALNGGAWDVIAARCNTRCTVSLSLFMTGLIVGALVSAPEDWRTEVQDWIEEAGMLDPDY
jgi:hypothetical protein